MAQSFFPITPVDISPGSSGSWVDVNVSAYVPSGTTGAILHIVNTGGAFDDFAIGLRKNGSTDDRTNWILHASHFWAMIGVDGSRIFEAYEQDHTKQKIYLVGYTKAGVTFKTNADDISLTEVGSYQGIDCSTEAPDAVAIIVEVHANILLFSLRKNGSTDERYGDCNKHSWALPGCDDSQIIEGKIESTGCDFFLVGYVTFGAGFRTNGADKSLTTINQWLDIDCSSEAPDAVMLFFECFLHLGAENFGMRKNGSAEDIFYWCDQLPWAFVECDDAQKVEGKIEDTDVDFFLIGYTTEEVEKTSSDTGSGVDVKASGNPLATLARSEVGGGIDGHKAVAPQSAGESGSGVDALTSLLGILARSDTGLGTDARLSLAVALIKADAGSGVEAILGRAIVLAELGAGLEHILDRALVLTELGLGLDSTLKEKTSSDDGIGSDAILALLDRVFTEYGYGLDASIWGDRPLLATDLGLGIESSLLRDLGQPKYSCDVGAGIDASTLASLFTRADSGVATEAIALLAAVLEGDNGQGVDALVEVTATFKEITTYDAGQGVDEVLSYLRKLVDSGQGEENLHLVGVIGRRMRMRVYQREAFSLTVYTSETGN